MNFRRAAALSEPRVLIALHFAFVIGLLAYLIFLGVPRTLPGLLVLLVVTMALPVTGFLFFKREHARRCAESRK